MGNNCCVSRTPSSSGVNLDKKEKRMLKEKFNSMVESQSE